MGMADPGPDIKTIMHPDGPNTGKTSKLQCKVLRYLFIYLFKFIVYLNLF